MAESSPTQSEKITAFLQHLDELVQDMERESLREKKLFEDHLDMLFKMRIKALTPEERQMNCLDYLAKCAAKSTSSESQTSAVDEIDELLQSVPPPSTKRKTGRTAKKTTKKAVTESTDLENIPENCATVTRTTRPKRTTRQANVPATPLNQQIPSLGGIYSTARKPRRNDKLYYGMLSERGSPVQGGSTIGFKAMQLIHKIVADGGIPSQAMMKKLRSEFARSDA